MRQFYPDAATSRSASREMDNLGVDLVRTGNLQIQCKNTKDKPDYPNILKNMPNGPINVIFHKYTKKSKTRFTTIGKYAILDLDDFIKLIKMIHDRGTNEI